MASCCLTLIQPARIRSKNCHGCRRDFIFLRMRLAKRQHPGSAESCQVSEKRLGRLEQALLFQPLPVRSSFFTTRDFTIVQSAARDNVFMIEISGGPRDIVWVVLYTNGIPTLELKRVTKGTAAVTINESLFTLVISGIYAGDAPPRTETHSYKLSLDDLFSPGRRKRGL